MRKLLTIAALAALFALPASAGDFSLYGAYWDTDAADDALGGGLRLGIPLGEVITLDFRATYYEELVNRPFERVGDLETPFVDNGIQVLPVDLGLRFRFAGGETVTPYIGGGGTYYFLDSDFGNLKDEAGWYALGGVEVGSFFVEGQYRGVEVTVENDPADFDDIDDIEFDPETAVKLDGFGVNAGWVWRF